MKVSKRLMLLVFQANAYILAQKFFFFFTTVFYGQFPYRFLICINYQQLFSLSIFLLFPLFIYLLSLTSFVSSHILKFISFISCAYPFPSFLNHIPYLILCHSLPHRCFSCINILFSKNMTFDKAKRLSFINHRWEHICSTLRMRINSGIEPIDSPALTFQSIDQFWFDIIEQFIDLCIKKTKSIRLHLDISIKR